MSIHKNNNKQQLDEMPDEILEEIFSFLDIGSKKGLSLVSKKFNQIFGLPKNLDRIKFRVVRNRERMCKITRQYRHIVEPGRLILAATLSKFTNMTSYTRDGLFNDTDAKYYYHLVDLLPYFRNLSFLDIRIPCGQTVQAQMLQKLKDRTGFDIVEMKHLKTLKVSLRLFMILNDFVKFSSCKLLTHLKITKNSKTSFDEFNFEPLKSFIMSQKHLKVLNISVEFQEILKLFDTPLTVQSHLKVFKLVSDLDPGFKSTQQDNLADFVMSQTTLSELMISIRGIRESKTSKMQHLMNTRLRMPLVKRKIILLKEIREDFFDLDLFTIDQLTQAKQPNQALKHLELFFDFDVPESSRAAAVDFVSMNYPGLMTLETPGYDKKPLSGIEELNKLKHMEFLTLPLRQFQNESAIKIPTLKKLHMLLDRSDVANVEGHVGFNTNLNVFFQQHKLIEETDMIIDEVVEENDYDKMKSMLHELVISALMHLRGLRKFTISIEWSDYHDFDGVSVSPEALKENWTSMSKLFADSMQNFAKGGFVLQCGPTGIKKDSKKLMKTFDGAVVEIE